MIYAHPGTPGALFTVKPRYGNYIGGQFVPPVNGQHFQNTTPVTGAACGEFPRSDADDVNLALDAAHAAAPAWGKTSVQERARILLRIAEDRKSTRLNSSHVRISYAVFCLKKKIL